MPANPQDPASVLADVSADRPAGATAGARAGAGTQVRDNHEASRFELPLPGGDLAFVSYRRHDGALWLTHAEVPPAYEGKGVGSQLVQGTLERIRATGERVVPVCSFVVAWMRRHPAYDDLRHPSQA